MEPEVGGAGAAVVEGVACGGGEWPSLGLGGRSRLGATQLALSLLIGVCKSLLRLALSGFGGRAWTTRATDELPPPKLSRDGFNALSVGNRRSVGSLGRPSRNNALAAKSFSNSLSALGPETELVLLVDAVKCPIEVDPLDVLALDEGKGARAPIIFLIAAGPVGGDFLRFGGGGIAGGGPTGSGGSEDTHADKFVARTKTGASLDEITALGGR